MSTRTNLINTREELKWNGKQYIQCGIFRNTPVEITKDQFTGTCRLEYINDCGFFSVLFKGTEEEVFDYYLSTMGSLGR